MVKGASPNPVKLNEKASPIKALCPIDETPLSPIFFNGFLPPAKTRVFTKHQRGVEQSEEIPPSAESVKLSSLSGKVVSNHACMTDSLAASPEIHRKILSCMSAIVYKNKAKFEFEPRETAKPAACPPPNSTKMLSYVWSPVRRASALLALELPQSSFSRSR
jgi:hypothetical protein